LRVPIPLFCPLTRPPPPSPPFPYTTLFRSPGGQLGGPMGQFQGAALERHGQRQACPSTVQTRQERGQFLLRTLVQPIGPAYGQRSEEHTSELQSRFDLVCRLLLEKKKRTDD